MKMVSWPEGCNGRVCPEARLWPAEGNKGTERAETKGELGVSSATGDGGTGDKGHLESGEIDGLLTDMVAREGCDKVIDGETHDCGMEGRGRERERRRG